MTTDDRQNETPQNENAADQTATEEDIAVEHAADRLVERFPEVPREHIEELVEEHHEEFEGAPVRDFVPVLIEHDVKQELNAEERAD
ncbi:three-helix bundle dimerization domain-containing protein [Leifsonia sp. SIMBA_070]|uniref:three-helix bundle dimerization domain-containing protein n=1 Tax=Leifsonia sp. SIMBA_070 TaxID=3085810 RepID=UPI003979E6E9